MAPTPGGSLVRVARKRSAPCKPAPSMGGPSPNGAHWSILKGRAHLAFVRPQTSDLGLLLTARRSHIHMRKFALALSLCSSVVLFAADTATERLSDTAITPVQICACEYVTSSR